MSNNDLKKEAERLLSLEGNVRGEALRTHAEYVKKKEGEEGLEKVKKEWRILVFLWTRKMWIPDLG